MAYAIYKIDRFGDNLIGVCNNNEVVVLLDKLNREYASGDSPEMINLKEQQGNIKNKIEKLKHELIKIDRSKVDPTEHMNLTKLLNLANMEVNKKITEANKNLQDVETKIRDCKNGKPYFSVKVKKMKTTS